MGYFKIQTVIQVTRLLSFPVKVRVSRVSTTRSMQVRLVARANMTITWKATSKGIPVTFLAEARPPKASHLQESSPGTDPEAECPYPTRRTVATSESSLLECRASIIRTSPTLYKAHAGKTAQIKYATNKSPQKRP